MKDLNSPYSYNSIPVVRVSAWLLVILFAMTAGVRASGSFAPPKRVKLTVNTPDNGLNYPDAMATLKLQPGDTIEVPAGDYAYLYLGKVTGTVSSPVVVINSGGQVRLGINNKVSAGSSVFPVSTCSFLEISGSGTPGITYGFDINGTNTTGGKQFGIYIGEGSTDINVHHINIHDVSTFLVAKTTQTCTNTQWQDGNFVMTNVKIHDIRGRNSVDEAFYIGNSNYLFPFTGPCVNLKSHWLENLEVYNNDLDNIGKDGIQISLARGPNNKVYNNRLSRYGLERNDAHGYGILCGGGSTLQIYNNVVTDGYEPAITIFGSGLQKIYNNLIRNIEFEGISVYDKDASGITPGTLDYATTRIYNNTIINTDNNQYKDAIKIFSYKNPTPHWLYNNLLVVAGQANDIPSRGIYARGSQAVPFVASNNLQIADINAVGFVNVGGNDFHLTATSPAVDKGKDITELTTDMDGHSRPENGLYDIGAYEFTSSPANVAPVANAGADQTIQLPASTATLDGSGSNDTDGTITYAWAKISGPAGGTFASTTAVKPVVSALQQGTYVFELTVIDNKGATAKDQVSVTVNAASNVLPVANAGTDQTIQLPASSATLDGSGSSDTDGTITYAWAKISGPAGGTFASTTVVKPVVSALQQGTYVFELTITDNKGAIAKDQVSIIVNPASNVLPVANAGTDQTIQLPASTTTLDGSGSRDQDGSISYAWAKVSGPAGGTFSNATIVKPVVSGLQAGTYVFQLTVTDNSNASATDQVIITVLPVTTKPVANAGADQQFNLPKNTTVLDGSASSGGSAGITSYRWEKISGPDVVFSNTDVAVQEISQLVVGEYVFRLSITNEAGLSSSATTKVTVLPVPNKAPVAIRGDLTIDLPNTSLDVSADSSYDEDGTITTYAWQQLGGPKSTMIWNKSASATKISDMRFPGAYEFRLTITDDKGATAVKNFNVFVVEKKPDAAAPEVIVFPNPVVDVLHINLQMPESENKLQLQVFNMQGTLLNTDQINGEGRMHKEVLVQNLPAGTFLIKITGTKGYSYSHLFVKATSAR